ncbi:hypothetical protein EHQ53_10490 [Leptospira langatensis]|uniref:Uncharacterized protein n=1 Tax=Leptospira langatensis TaxID=2484983 RepID=A0A5F1ZS38_9LEPT|nr:hypothetical protein [Leptospira langatensis]TGJ99008.1 hypothetical protein EHO57_16010 [Leptospira langatensis]TGL40424.1 hypothetical protein EHQ53_10490 [Leptospira langatensis]
MNDPVTHNFSFWDNWTFESISSLYSEGLDFSNSKRLKVDRDRNSYDWEEICEACVQIESLFSLINELVLREKIFYDSKFSDGWRSFERLNSLDGTLLIPVDIPTFNPVVAASRNQALELLCVTEKMRQHQKENLIGYQETRKSPHDYFGQVVWGTAGNFGRSSFLGAHYVPHPIRASLLERTNFLKPNVDLGTEVKEWINEERVKLFAGLTPLGKVHHFELILPPLVAEVLESSSNLSEIIDSSLELREKYKRIREWIGEYQAAIESEDPSQVSNFKKTLDLVNKDLADMKKGSELGDTSVGVSFLSVKVPSPKIPDVRKFWGIRSALNKLILNRKGERALARLLSWLDCEGEREMELIKDHFHPQK